MQDSNRNSTYGGDSAVTDSGGLLPFNPHTTGPVDLLGAAARRLHAFVRRNERLLIGLFAFALVAQLAAYLHSGYVVDLPSVPNWMLVGIGVFIVLLPFAIPTGWMLEKWFGSDDSIPVSIQNPVTGDQRIRWMTPAKFDAMTIYSVDPSENKDAEEVGRDYLERVLINGIMAYELEWLDEEENVAVSSSMAGRSNSQIRRDRHEIGAIKTELITEADKAVEFIVRSGHILRRQGEEVANELIRVYEDVALPEGGELHERLVEEREKANPADDLLGDSYNKGRSADDDGDSGSGSGSDPSRSGSNPSGSSSTSEPQSIHERAAAEQAAATDGGEDR